MRKRIGHIPFLHLKSFHVGEYLDLGVKEGRAVRANRERALLSHACSIAMRKGWLSRNPCSGVARNSEVPRERYIEDHEMTAMRSACNLQTRALAILLYRTLQRPEDILSWTSENIISRLIGDKEMKVLKFRSGKTKHPMEIIITSELEAVFDELAADNRRIPGMTLIHNRKGLEYTLGGMDSMWAKARAKVAQKMPSVADFALYDLKGKGATDMYRDCVPLTEISHLCGHDSVRTTETYIKARLVRPVAPNVRKVA